MLTTDFRHVIDEICKSKLIISSSLHGVILAEAYKVPAVLLLKENENSFKYHDYYHSTGRYKILQASSVEEAQNCDPMELPDLSELRANLINSFPIDLWSTSDS